MSLSRIIGTAVFLAMIVLNVTPVLGGRNSQKVASKASKRNTFGDGPFDPCKGAKSLNPVEAVRQNMLASRIVSAVGTDRIVYLIRRHKFPAQAFYEIGKKLCIMWSLCYGYFSDSGEFMLGRNSTGKDIIQLLDYFITAIRHRGYCMEARYGKSVFRVSLEACKDMLTVVGPPLVHFENGTLLKDGNSALHSIRQFRKIFS